MKKFPLNCGCGDMLCPWPAIRLILWILAIFFGLATLLLT